MGKPVTKAPEGGCAKPKGAHQVFVLLPEVLLEKPFLEMKMESGSCLRFLWAPYLRMG